MKVENSVWMIKYDQMRSIMFTSALIWHLLPSQLYLDRCNTETEHALNDVSYTRFNDIIQESLLIWI
jgi:hypothetical protein